MRFLDLSPSFRCRAVEDGHEVWIEVDRIEEADGVEFLCPKCFQANAGPVGTHAIMCWRPRVPSNVDPKPGRWEFSGTGLSDLTLSASSSSILVTGDGSCGAHFYIRNGNVE